ncbi:nucleoside-diphosphate kinase [Rickettsia endosymbiont of Cardiosporidium cionae]|uniref:nucleoside-diphosphate kinase n=1 Tax=Rickettsia endosymbiont of Cardiosporidium cionae TaxID=2777155 RepID=UPI0018931CDB|nr:nucleoside-diphosphate kinase [Rickettsia endosymbiont of Cardiosporidium cionae]KAF8818289.1 nucleoside-diphosphate kinase [Rickettsia endosymbiont of Cardiosporidium cionae]
MIFEYTLSIIKPDITKRNLIGLVIADLESVGLKIVAQRMLLLSKVQAEAFYMEHNNSSFFGDLVEYMISGPVVVQVLQGENAIYKNRKIMGATDPVKAAEGTIRQKFAQNIQANSIHGSDSTISAAREIDFFFKQHEILE